MSKRLARIPKMLDYVGHVDQIKPLGIRGVHLDLAIEDWRAAR
jgi:hypothetical protein